MKTSPSLWVKSEKQVEHFWFSEAGILWQSIIYSQTWQVALPGRDAENCIKLFLYSAIIAENYQLQTNYRSSKCMQAMCSRLLHSFLLFFFFCHHHFLSLVGIRSLRKLFKKIVIFCYGNALYWKFKIMLSPLQTTAILLRPIYFSHLASIKKK